MSTKQRLSAQEARRTWVGMGGPPLAAPTKKTAAQSTASQSNAAQATVRTVTQPADSALLATLVNSSAAEKARAEQLAAEKEALARQTYSDNLAALETAYNNRAAYLKEAYESGVSQLADARAESERTVNRTVDGALKEAYLSAMQAKRDLPAQLSGMGLTGGAAESTLASLQNKYLAGRSQLEGTRAEELAAVLGDWRKNSAAAQQSYQTQLAGEQNELLTSKTELAQQLATGIAALLTEKLTAQNKADSTLAAQLASLLK